MTSTISTNMAAVHARNVFDKNNANMAKAMSHATTGLRINSPEESGANYTISEKMRERINSLSQAERNIQNDTSLLKTAEGAITNTVDLLRTSRALVVQAVDASTNDNDRITIAKELTKIFEQIDYNATSTKYNGKILLTASGTTKVDADSTGALGKGMNSGTAPPTLQFQIGDDSGAIMSNVKLQDMTLKGLGIFTGNTGYSKITTLTTASAAGTYFRASDNNGGTGSGATLLNQLSTALNTALYAATEVGAYEQRLGYTADNVSTQIENLEASDSTIRDANMAKEISDYMKFNVLSQASQYMLAQANQNAFSVLNLLQ